MSNVVIWSYLQDYHCSRLRYLADETTSTVTALLTDPAPSDCHIPSTTNTGKAKIIHRPLTTHTTHFIWSTLNTVKPQAIAITGWYGLASWSALVWSLLHRSTTVLLLETQEIDGKRFFLKEWSKIAFLYCCDYVFAGGNTHKDYAEKLLFDPAKILIGYDAVDNDYWHSKSTEVLQSAAFWRNRLSLPSKYFICVGRFIDKKNQASLLLAYSSYLSARNSVDCADLIFIGDGPQLEKVKSLAIKLGIQDKVHFLGYLLPKDSVVYYSLADACILPSSHSEQWGLVINEALACGTPVIVSQICGCCNDLVVGKRTGLTFNPKDPLALTNCLFNISKEYSKTDEFRTHALQVVNRFSCKKWASKLISFYSHESFSVI